MSSGVFLSVSVLLLAGSLLLAGFVYATLQSGYEGSSATIIRSQPGATEVDEAGSGADGLGEGVMEVNAASLDVIEDRPLFSPTRRPPAVDGSTVAPTSGLGEIKLIGTMLWEKEQRAVFRVAGESKELVVAEGETIRGWQVVSVESRMVVLERNGVRETLSLEFSGSQGKESRANEKGERAP